MQQFLYLSRKAVMISITQGVHEIITSEFEDIMIHLLLGACLEYFKLGNYPKMDKC